MLTRPLTQQASSTAKYLPAKPILSVTIDEGAQRMKRWFFRSATAKPTVVDTTIIVGLLHLNIFWHVTTGNAQATDERAYCLDNCRFHEAAYIADDAKMHR